MEEYNQSSSNNGNNTKITKNSSGSFQNLGLEKEILKGVLTMGYKIPTPVQRKTLPIALVGMDVVCMARTGSGKTLAFLIPLMQKLKEHEHSKGVRGIVLSPTRELAIQTLKFAKDVAKFTTLRIISIVGGDGIESQYDSLSNQPDVLIATPGRLHHHLHEISTFKLKSVQYIVFDEADRLFEMGFAEQINEILRQCPLERQTLLFSATMPKALIQFSRAGLRDPQLIRLDTDVKMSEELRLGFFCVRTDEKLAALLYLVRQIIPKNQSTIIFAATKHHSEFIFMLLEHIGLKCSLVYGSMDQESRQTNLRSFRLGEVNYLIVTDLAARGIDIPLINNVINFHFPATPKLFVHRCGRAARQGRIGYAFSIIEPDEMPYAVDVHRFLDVPIVTADSIPDSNTAMDDSTNLSSITYTLSTMTPTNIHTGLLPQDVLNEEVEYMKSVLHDHDGLAAAYKVSENAMKQYRRTRTSATHDGVKTTKKLVKEDKIRSIHPLIQGMDPSRCDQTIIAKADYIRMLQTFRPAQTVLETGIGTGSMNQHNKKKRSGGDAGREVGIDVMKALRQANDGFLERNRRKLSVEATIDASGNDDVDEDVHTSSFHDAYHDDNDIADDQNVDDEYDNDDEDDEDDHDEVGSIGDASIISLASRPRLSISEKKKLKKKGYSADDMHQYLAQKAMMSNTIDSRSHEKSYRDPKFYMAYGTEDERATYAEDSLQPKSGLRSSETQSAMMLENALLDLTGSSDNLVEQSKNKKITHWDEKKRKFVKQTLSEMATSGRKGAKRLRSESGVSAPSKRKKGELYEKWKKKSNREIGVFDGGAEDPYDNRPRPNARVNTDAKDEVRNTEQVRKLHLLRQKNKIKNMDKEKRLHVRSKMKADREGADQSGGGASFSRGRDSSRGGRGRGGGRDASRGGGGRDGSGRGGGGRGGGGRGGGGRGGGGRGGGGGGDKFHPGSKGKASFSKGGRGRK